jgi:Fur family transcriptional regulator, iron response regulator
MLQATYHAPPPKGLDTFGLTPSGLRHYLNSIVKHDDDAAILREHGIQPSAQRLAVASYVLHTTDHPTADVVFQKVQGRCPMLSRATIYNSLNLLVAKGLLRQLTLAEGRVVFDPLIERHHHLVDEATGAIHDIPWDALSVKNVEKLEGYDVREYSVVLKGKRRRR